MPALSDYDLQSLAQLLQDWNANPSHASKLLRTFYTNAGQLDLKPLSVGRNLESHLRDKLPLRQSSLAARSLSSDGTIKLLLNLDRGGTVESVLMPAYDPTRAAGCVSSQIGCPMGCDFCASTATGLERNLEPGEIVEQFLHLKEQAASIGRRLATLVFMGMGEPMHNLPNVIAAIRRISHPSIGALGPRHISVSTVGIVPGIESLAAANLNVHLALSLHAPDDLTRAKLVPMNRRYGVAEILSAARTFHEQTGRIVNIEYCLIDSVNDFDEQAILLSQLLENFRAHVNLIPYNPIGRSLSGLDYHRPSPDRVLHFGQLLRDRGVVTHIRRTRGDDVNASCGQLRQRYVQLGPSDVARASSP